MLVSLIFVQDLPHLSKWFLKTAESTLKKLEATKTINVVIHDP